MGPEGGAEPHRRSIPDAILTVVGGAMILVAVYLLLFGGPGDGGVAAVTAPPPALELLAPADGDTVRSIELELRTGAPLRTQPGGWGSGGFHLHAELDGREIMPGPTDIRRSSVDAYIWTFPPLAPGSHRINLFWSDSSHLPVAGTATPSIRLVIPY